MVYNVLCKDTIPGYVRGLKRVSEALGGDCELLIDEIGDGNLNYVFRVYQKGNPDKSVILKQSVPYLRMAGESWPLNKNRMIFETRALLLYSEIVPEYVPEVYHSDEEMCVLVMEDLRNHIVLRGGMIRGNEYADVGFHIGDFLAKTLFRTSVYEMGSVDRRALMGEFVLNDELCKLTEEFIFTFPLMVHPSNYVNPVTEEYANKHLRTDTDYKLATMRLKEKFLCDTGALLHGDLHTGSLMANATDTIVIDPEFAFFGPMGFDVGKIIANFLLNYTSHFYHSDAEYQSWVLKQAIRILDTFSAKFLELWQSSAESAMFTSGLLSEREVARYKEEYMVGLLRDTVGFCACSLTRRTLGIAGVADIRNIDDAELRAELEIMNLELARRLMKSHMNINSVDEFESIVRSFYSNK